MHGMSTVSNIKPSFVGKNTGIRHGFLCVKNPWNLQLAKPSVFDKYIPQIWRMDIQTNPSSKELPLPNNHL